MRHRAQLVLSIGCLFVACPAEAQTPARVPRIAVFGTAHFDPGHAWDRTFVEALAELGHVVA